MKKYLGLGKILVNLLLGSLFLILFFFSVILLYISNYKGSIMSLWWFWLIETFFVFLSIQFLTIGWFCKKIISIIKPYLKPYYDSLKMSFIKSNSYKYYSLHIENELYFIFGLLLLVLSVITIALIKELHAVAVILALFLFKAGASTISNLTNSRMKKLAKNFFAIILNLFVKVPFKILSSVLDISIKIITSTFFKWLMVSLIIVLFLLAAGAIISSMSATTIIIILLVLILLK